VLGEFKVMGIWSPSGIPMNGVVEGALRKRAVSRAAALTSVYRVRVACVSEVSLKATGHSRRRRVYSAYRSGERIPPTEGTAP
jgi:hypothetical protein